MNISHSCSLLLTSTFPCIAAWGELQNGQRGETFKVFHWELGVFLSPNILGKERVVPFQTDQLLNHEESVIPLPYKFHPERYSSSDEAWTVDDLYAGR